MKRGFANFYHKLYYKKKIGSFRPLSLFPKRKRRDVRLPKDDGFLSDQEVQWWYWTGHLNGKCRETGEMRKFGFEVVFFAFDSWIFFKNQLAQAAVSDITDGTYHYREEVRYLSLPKKLKNKFNLIMSEEEKVAISAVGEGGKDRLTAEVDDYKFDLQLDSIAPPVIRYDGKAHEYQFGGYTYYYSREKMKTTGTMQIADKTYDIEGISWFDRQYGDLYFAIFKGWQWFAVSMNDGRTVMLYDFLGENEDEKYGSVVNDDKYIQLWKNDFKVHVMGSWKSPDTGITYPSGWKVELKDKKGNIIEEFIVEPLLKDQELHAKHIFWIGPEYWEGDCSVTNMSGEVIGKAYVELNGFGHKFLSMDILDDGKTDFGI